MIVIKNYTKSPLSKMGEIAGYCYDTTNSKFFERIAKQCLDEGHGRVQEFPEITFEFSGFSAKVIREMLRHVHLSALQASTRYIDYTKQFGYIIPPSVAKNEEAKSIWQEHMNVVAKTMEKLKEKGVPTEDFTNVLPLAYETKGVIKVGLRELIHMFSVRSCSCAYHEARLFMKEIKEAVKKLDDEQWVWLANTYFVPKCVRLMYCEEEKRWASCKLYPKKSMVKKWIEDKKSEIDWRNM